MEFGGRGSELLRNLSVNLDCASDDGVLEALDGFSKVPGLEEAAKD